MKEIKFYDVVVHKFLLEKNVEKQKSWSLLSTLLFERACACHMVYEEDTTGFCTQHGSLCKHREQLNCEMIQVIRGGIFMTRS